MTSPSPALFAYPSWPWSLGTPVNVPASSAPATALPNDATTSLRVIRPRAPQAPWPAPTVTRPCQGGQCGARTSCRVPLLTQTSSSADDEQYRSTACGRTLNP